ncbi:hypothetical protein [Pedobacter foliorum]|uniref:hypothetical protein n=1 Tax=Pedobacter foliorum TaxID=2739058 RepID=UPI00156629C4|nr:hypothetical protein [Pedobacter foliorum]NRF41109.1 hypothetical protein [Pedobacter foliorum]
MKQQFKKTSLNLPGATPRGTDHSLAKKQDSATIPKRKVTGSTRPNPDYQHREARAPEGSYQGLPLASGERHPDSGNYLSDQVMQSHFRALGFHEKKSKDSLVYPALYKQIRKYLNTTKP